MKLSGHLTRAIFSRYNIVSEQDLTDAVRKLQKFQEATEPACAPAETQPRVSRAASFRELTSRRMFVRSIITSNPSTPLNA
jgi:hypothetical protein